MRYGILIIIGLCIIAMQASGTPFNENVAQPSVRIRSIEHGGTVYPIYNDILYTDDLEIGDEVFIDFLFSGTTEEKSGELFLQFNTHLTSFSPILHDTRGYISYISSMPMQISLLYLLKDTIYMDTVIITNQSIELLAVDVNLEANPDKPDHISFTDNKFKITVPKIHDTYIVTHELQDYSSGKVMLYKEMGILSVLHIEDVSVSQNTTMTQFTGTQQSFLHETDYTSGRFSLTTNYLTTTVRSENQSFYLSSSVLVLIIVWRKFE